MHIKLARGSPLAPVEDGVMASPPEEQKMVRPNSHDSLPLYFSSSSVRKREVGRSHDSWLAEIAVHAVPVVVLLCLFILWWCCYPPDALEMKKGRVLAINLIDNDNSPFNNTQQSQLEVAVLTVATMSHVPSVDPQNLTEKNVTHQEKPSSKRLAEKSDYSIFYIVLLCLVIFWWLCFAATIEMNPLRVAAIKQIDNNYSSFKDTHLEIAFLSVATTSPVTSVDPQNLKGKNIIPRQDKPLRTKNRHQPSVAP